MIQLPPVRFVGAKVLREGRLRDDSIALSEGRLADAAFPDIDLHGYLVLPGIIDLHGDGFERHIAPRRNAHFPLAEGLASFDRECAAHGVTTAYMAQSWSWEGAQRSPDAAIRLAESLRDWKLQSLTDLRMQIRAETHLADTAELLIATVRRFDIDLVIFNDHLAEGLQMAHSDPASFSHWAERLGRNPVELRASILTAQERAGEVPRHLCALANAFETLGVTYGSHDDPDAETRERYRMMGALIAEFPTSYGAAAAAEASGNPVLMGAPNAVRGQSHTGNISARTLIADGLCTALVSDYHIPALPLAARVLTERGLLSFEAAWALVSSGPARAVGFEDRGQVAAGRRADLVVMNAETMQIEATISAGKLSHLSGAVARRLLTQREVARLAAE
jgi:alpha-D-ribose 1-methylphosphonate 5-triphosphate diphosphatase